MGFIQRFMISIVLLNFFMQNYSAQSLDELLSSLSAPKQNVPIEGPVVEKQIATPSIIPPVTAPGVKEPLVINQPSIPKALPEINQPIVSPVLPFAKAPEGVAAPVVMPKMNEPAVMQPSMQFPKISPFPTPIQPMMMPTPIQPVAPSMQPKMISAPLPSVAKVPASPEAQILNIHEVTSSGLDTINVDAGGNWLEKQVWYKKGEQLFEIIRNSLQKANDLRMKFVHEVNQVGQQIDSFYETVSFQKGQIDEMMQAVLQSLANQTEIRGGDLSAEERSLKEKIKNEQKQIEAVGKDLKLIEDLDEQIDKTMTKAFKEIEACRGLETRAWNNFKEIGLELDDKKARVLYLEMENFHKNIEQKMTYLQNNLLPYLQNQLIAKVNQTTSQIKNNVSELASKGLHMNSLLQKDEHDDLIILKQREKMVEQSAIDAAEKAKHQDAKTQPKKSKPETWYGNLWNTLLSYLQPVVCTLYQWIMVVCCSAQCLFCKIQEWICRLFGY